jgi:hypothetical protein
MDQSIYCDQRGGIYIGCDDMPICCTWAVIYVLAVKKIGQRKRAAGKKQVEQEETASGKNGS